MPRSRPEGTKFPAYSGGFLIDDFRGQRRVRAWPRKRGRPKSELVREQNDWFKAVTQIVKLAAPDQTVAAMDATKGQGVYPRDLLMHTISEGIMDITELDGTFVQHRRPRVDGVAFQGARIERAAAFSLVAGVNTVVTWDDPVIDTAAMWNIASPTILTVPVGVTVINFSAGFWTSSTQNGETRLTLGEVGGTSYILATRDAPFRQGHTEQTGPLDVVAGQTYQVLLLHDTGCSLSVGGPTFFAAEILGTT